MSQKSHLKFVKFVYGSKDHLIHCFREGQTYENGAQMLKEQLVVRHKLSLNANPFTDSDVEDATEDFMLFFILWFLFYVDFKMMMRTTLLTFNLFSL